MTVKPDPAWEGVVARHGERDDPYVDPDTQLNNIDMALARPHDREMWWSDEDPPVDHSAPLRPDNFRDPRYELDDGGDRERAVTGNRNIVVCRLCGWPLPLQREWGACEFPGTDRSWNRSTCAESCGCNQSTCPSFCGCSSCMGSAAIKIPRTAEDRQWINLIVEARRRASGFILQVSERVEFCACNGCNPPIKRRKGSQPAYCSQECADRMDNALDRADRRANGARSRKFDPAADRIANYRIDFKIRARRRKDDDSRFEFDWSKIWAYPATRPQDNYHSLRRISQHEWVICGGANLHRIEGRNSGTIHLLAQPSRVDQFEPPDDFAMGA